MNFEAHKYLDKNLQYICIVRRNKTRKNKTRRNKTSYISISPRKKVYIANDLWKYKINQNKNLLQRDQKTRKKESISLSVTPAPHQALFSSIGCSRE